MNPGTRYPFLDLATVNAPYADEVAARLADVVARGRYVGGPEVDEFEARLRHVSGADFAIGVSNGLDALRLILLGYIRLGRLQPGDEVIVPANTYIASVLAITHAGLVPVLAEPDALTSNLDTSRLEELIGPRTRAIMPVHLYGRVCFDDALISAARRHNLLVIEDNAQAIGAVSANDGLNGTRATGSLGHAAAFSFYPTKNIGGMGDAGAVTTSDPELAATVRALANYGADRRYHNIHAGFNCRLDTMQAAVLNVKLPHTAEENTMRRSIARIYCEEIRHPDIRLPLMTDDCVFHQFVIHTDRRDELTAYLTSNGIGWDMHYATPPHLQPCYRAERSSADNAGIIRTPSGPLRLPKGGLSITEHLADTLLSLPISRCTTQKDAREIADIINNWA